MTLTQNLVEMRGVLKNAATDEFDAEFWRRGDELFRRRVWKTNFAGSILAFDDDGENEKMFDGKIVVFFFINYRW